MYFYKRLLKQHCSVHVSSAVETLRPLHIAQMDAVTVRHCTTVHIICTMSNR